MVGKDPNKPEPQVNPQKVIDFVNSHNVRLTFRQLGKQGGVNLTMSVDGAHLPFPGGEPGQAAISCIMQLMTAKGVSPYHGEIPGT